MFKMFKKKAIKQSRDVAKELVKTKEEILEDEAKEKASILCKEMGDFLKKELPCLEYTLEELHWHGHSDEHENSGYNWAPGISMSGWIEEAWHIRANVIVKPLKSSKDTFNVYFKKVPNKENTQTMILRQLEKFKELRKEAARKDREFKKAFCK